MTLSVLMSVYKNETAAHLNRSLKSIWTDQTHKPDKIILVEDGPLTDDLYQVIQSWRSTLGNVLCSPKNETNQGLTAALNKGLSYVDTDFVARMDSDDYSASNRFELQLSFFESHPEIDIIGGAIQEFNDENPCIGVRHYPTQNIEDYICKGSPLAHPSTMMRTRIFTEGGLRYDPNYPLNEDIALWFDALRKGYKISNLSDVIYFFECSGGMFERRSKQKALPEFKAYMRGIYDTKGLFTYRYIFPICRYIFRQMPTSLIKKVYAGKGRQALLGGE